MKKAATFALAAIAFGWLLALPAGELSLSLNQTATNDATLIGDGTRFVTTAIPDSDAAGQVLRYDTTTNAFSAGTLTDADISGDGTRIGSNTIVFDFPAEIAANCAESTEVTVTGAAFGDSCDLGMSARPPADAAIFCEVSAADKAIVKHCCTVSCDPNSMTYTVVINR